jgi:SOUL heme-binding protein
MCRKRPFTMPFLCHLAMAFAVVSTPAMAIEEPAFRLAGRSGGVEFREYPALLVAETRVKADFAEAGNVAFRLLANYIFGNNRGKAKIDMTAPVSQAPAEKIDMTAPVTQRAPDQAGEFVVAFTMPAKFTRATIPEPVDERVVIREIPARSMAVRAYSGTWSQTRFEEQVKLLLDEVAKSGRQARGPVEFARYDPPMMPWFLRRNEVMVEVTEVSPPRVEASPGNGAAHAAR